MDEPWLERWKEGRTGWHEPEGNRNLKTHWDSSGHRVLVPLCGKTQDLLWLEAQGNEVVGIELAEMAIVGFFEDNGLAYVRRDGRLAEYRALERRITLYCGDYFDFSGERFDAHYDRGALGALPVEVRKRYAAHTSSLLSEDAEQFVVTVEYDQRICDGPPFSISEEEILRYWPTLYRHVAIDDTANAPPKFLEAGLERMHEVVWRTAR
jgi:thiopurine S-methyltransferase